VQTLLWKEWREHVWKLAFGSIILGAFALIGLHTRVVADEMLLEGVGLLAVLLLPVLSSTGLIPAERSDGTLAALLALPVRPIQVFAAKTVMGILLCAVPILVMALISIAAAGGREIPVSAMIMLFLRTLLASLVLLIWMIAVSVNLPSETRAALIAIGVQICWLMVTLALTDSWRGDTTDAKASPLWVLSPYVFLLGFRYGFWAVPLAAASAVQAGICLALWVWASRQFVAAAEGRS
jgi:ABC-type transport system involved in multi-copper enzyme maturation permease subunit